MRNSFQDQLLELGLVDKKKAGKVKKQKHQQKKLKGPKKITAVDENAEIARKAMAKKKERARELNQQREEKLQKRETVARIRQLVTEHLLVKDEKGVAYRFTFRGKIQRIFVNEEMVRQLGNGVVGIVGLSGKYEVIPARIIEKIRSIDSNIFVSLNVSSSAPAQDSDDPYAEYQVPDDLMW